ncbi:hypothetical protein PRZ48_002395 [Zasmidium cellare]|uniref:Uncharacterized protein n=1 Tax=Zasmidium cellare TaxID=395010 RepID=A0ABR0F630_ZASCE|nr:hypothetical protein PRZ48_002395 [Zasmidium cellare]
MTRGHKRPLNKLYPKGYAEKLERQQTQLVTGMQELYNRLVVSGAWRGATLPEINGQPLTHDLMTALDLVERRPSWPLSAISPIAETIDPSCSGAEQHQGGELDARCDFHEPSVPASPSEKDVWQSQAQLEASGNAVKCENVTSESSDWTLQQFELPSREDVSDPWEYLDISQDTFAPSNPTMKFQEYDVYANDIFASGIWPDWQNFEFEAAFRDAYAGDGFLWLSEGQFHSTDYAA